MSQAPVVSRRARDARVPVDGCRVVDLLEHRPRHALLGENAEPGPRVDETPGRDLNVDPVDGLEADWNAFIALVFAANPFPPTQFRWLAANDARVRCLLALRHRFGRFPRSNGAAERVADWLGTRFPRQRRFSLRNAKRLALVFGLIRAELAGQADPARMAAIVKRELGGLPARFAVDWTALTVPHSEPCTIAKLLVGARDRGRRNTAAYMASAKTRSVLRLLADEKEARAAAGLPPLVGGNEHDRVVDRVPRAHGLAGTRA